MLAQRQFYQYWVPDLFKLRSDKFWAKHPLLSAVTTRQKQNSLSSRAGYLSMASMLSLFPIIALLVFVGSNLDSHKLFNSLSYFHDFIPSDLRALIKSEADYRSTQGNNSSINSTNHWITVTIHTLVFVASSGTAVRSILNGLRQVANAKMSSWVLNIYGRSLVIVVTFGFFLILLPLLLAPVLALDYLINSFISLGWLSHFIQWLIMTIVIGIVINLLYRWVLFGCKSDKIYGIKGAFFASAMIALLSLLMTFATAHDPTISNEYGSYGIIRNVLIWLYGSSYCLLLGAQINQVLNQKESILKSVNK